MGQRKAEYVLATRADIAVNDLARNRPISRRLLTLISAGAGTWATEWMYLLRGICIHDKSHNFQLILGLNCVYIFPGVVYQPRHVFQNDDFGSKLCVHIPRSRYVCLARPAGLWKRAEGRYDPYNDGFCIKDDGFCIKDDGFCIKDDGFCI